MATRTEKAASEKAAAEKAAEQAANLPGRTLKGRAGGVWSRFQRFFAGRRDGDGRLVEKPTVSHLALRTEKGWNGTLKQWMEWPGEQREATGAVLAGMQVELLAEIAGLVREYGQEVLALLEEAAESRRADAALRREEVELLREALAQRRRGQIIEAPADPVDGDGGEDDRDGEYSDREDGDGEEDDGEEDDGEDDSDGESDSDSDPDEAEGR